MKKCILWNRNRLFVGVSLLLLLMLALPACSNNTPATATGLGTTSSVSVTTSLPQKSLGPQKCPGKAADPSYWDAVLGSKSGLKVEKVSCGNLIGKPALQALVVARVIGSAPAIRSAFVFDKINSSNPKLLFKVEHLYHGDAKISGYNTVLTAEVDLNSSINKGKPDGQLTVDLFREFKWSDAARSFKQTFFPGMCPDLTRYQAEADQAGVNQGHSPWKLDAEQVARNLTARLLNWPGAATTTLLSGGGAHDVSAVVQVHYPDPAGGIVKVTLSRLEGNTHNIWEAIKVESGGDLTITAPSNGSLLKSPATVQGKGPSFEGVIGKALILDHLYNDIGDAQVLGNGNGESPYSTSVTFHSTFGNGNQEGIVEVQVHSNANGSIATAVMEKAVISK